MIFTASSAASERVFSYVNRMFNDMQRATRDDHFELAVMLAFDKRPIMVQWQRHGVFESCVCKSA